eukprot:5424171-Pleurochrysis_carterae.AAC.1
MDARARAWHDGRHQRAGTATTVARKSSTGAIRELSTRETASYSRIAASTVGSESQSPSVGSHAG